jgi:hypothetical protein
MENGTQQNGSLNDMDDKERYFVGIDNSERMYVVPVSKRNEFYGWIFRVSGKMEMPEGVVRFTSDNDQTLTFSDFRFERLT